MAMAILTWLLAIPLLGVVTGMRTMTAMAVLCWFAYRGDLSLDDTWASWAAKLVTAIIFTVLALAELSPTSCQRPPTGPRQGPSLSRIIMGGLVGSIVAAGLNGSEFEGIILVRRRRIDRSLWRLSHPPRNRPAAWLPGLAGRLGRRRKRHLCAVLAMGIVTG